MRVGGLPADVDRARDARHAGRLCDCGHGRSGVDRHGHEHGRARPTGIGRREHDGVEAVGSRCSTRVAAVPRYGYVSRVVRAIAEQRAHERARRASATNLCVQADRAGQADAHDGVVEAAVPVGREHRPQRAEDAKGRRLAADEHAPRGRTPVARTVAEAQLEVVPARLQRRGVPGEIEWPARGHRRVLAARVVRADPGRRHPRPVTLTPRRLHARPRRHVVHERPGRERARRADAHRAVLGRQQHLALRRLAIDRREAGDVDPRRLERRVERNEVTGHGVRPVGLATNRDLVVLIAGAGQSRFVDEGVDHGRVIRWSGLDRHAGRCLRDPLGTNVDEVRRAAATRKRLLEVQAEAALVRRCDAESLTTLGEAIGRILAPHRIAGPHLDPDSVHTRSVELPPLGEEQGLSGKYEPEPVAHLIC